jgi:hypothetical protein
MGDRSTERPRLDEIVIESPGIEGLSSSKAPFKQQGSFGSQGTRKWNLNGIVVNSVDKPDAEAVSGLVCNPRLRAGAVCSARAAAGTFADMKKQRQRQRQRLKERNDHNTYGQRNGHSTYCRPYEPLGSMASPVGAYTNHNFETGDGTWKGGLKIIGKRRQRQKFRGDVQRVQQTVLKGERRTQGTTYSTTQQWGNTKKEVYYPVASIKWAPVQEKARGNGEENGLVGISKLEHQLPTFYLKPRAPPSPFTAEYQHLKRSVNNSNGLVQASRAGRSLTPFFEAVRPMDSVEWVNNNASKRDEKRVRKVIDLP